MFQCVSRLRKFARLGSRMRLVANCVWAQQKRKNPSQAEGFYRIAGGSGEIRTHEGLPLAGFQDRCLQPLGHASCRKVRKFSVSRRACGLCGHNKAFATMHSTQEKT